MTKNVYVVSEYVKRMSLDTVGGGGQRRAKEKGAVAVAVDDKMNPANSGKSPRNLYYF